MTQSGSKSAPPSPGWAVISSHYLNAWGVARNLLDAGWRGRIVCLRQAGSAASVMERFGAGVEVWQIPRNGDLLQFLAERIPESDSKWLFFTEEQSVQRIAASSGHPWLANTVWHPGPQCRLREIFDRFAFYDLAEKNGIGRTPRTISGASDPFEAFGSRFFFRYKVTWVRGAKTPRIRLIQNREEFESAKSAGREKGYSEPDWCFQEALSLAPEDNVSVCGWHEPDVRRYVATRKVLQFPAKQGNGDVCEIIPLPADLAETARRLLDELRFTGPFELEFVRDAASGQHYLIELNPRFWMQHPLAGANLGQALIRRYLGLPELEASVESLPKYWVNSIVGLGRLMRADFRGLKYLRHPQAIVVPPLAATLRWLPMLGLSHVARRLKR